MQTGGGFFHTSKFLNLPWGLKAASALESGTRVQFSLAEGTVRAPWACHSDRTPTTNPHLAGFPRLFWAQIRSLGRLARPVGCPHRGWLSKRASWGEERYWAPAERQMLSLYQRGGRFLLLFIRPENVTLLLGVGFEELELFFYYLCWEMDSGVR